MSAHLTTAEAAAELSVSPSRVRHLIRDGRLASEYVDREHHVTRASVRAFVRLKGGWPKGKPRGGGVHASP